MIEFLCPNGHKIHCPADQAGKPAKCPRCNVRFLIPAVTEFAATQPEGAGTPRVEGEASRSAPRPQAPRGIQIEFLCPNGHRLHGPASLQGRPGECPQCGSRFRIPTYDDVSDEVTFEQDIELGGANGRRDSDSRIGSPDVIPAGNSGAISGGRAPAIASPSDSGLALTHPLAQVLAKLWVEKARGAVVELQLEGGQTLVPDQFVMHLSQPSHGMFAVKDENGTFTLHAVAWDAVRQLSFRGVKKIPEPPA